ncbi:hypothetical protein ACVDFE_02065 [Lentzea chajnantorensis]
MTEPHVPDLSDAPVIDASDPVAPATPTRPAMSTPRMPPPAGLLDGEQRAEDGGVESATAQ